MNINHAQLIQIKAAMLKEAAGNFFKNRRRPNPAVQTMPFYPQQAPAPAVEPLPLAGQPGAAPSPAFEKLDNPAPQQADQPLDMFGSIQALRNSLGSNAQTLNNQRAGLNQLSSLFGGPQLATLPEQGVPGFEIPPGTPQGGGEPGAPENLSIYDKLRQGVANLPSNIRDFYAGAKNRQDNQQRQIEAIKGIPQQYSNILNQARIGNLKNYISDNERKRYKAIAGQDIDEQIARGMGQDYDRYGDNSKDTRRYTRNVDRGYAQLEKLDPTAYNNLAFSGITNFGLPALGNREFNQEAIAKGLEEARMTPGFAPTTSMQEPVGVPNSLEVPDTFVDMSPPLRSQTQPKPLTSPTAPAMSARDRARSLAEAPSDPLALSKLMPQTGGRPASRASLANLGDLGSVAGEAGSAGVVAPNVPQEAAKTEIAGYKPSITDPAALVAANTPQDKTLANAARAGVAGAAGAAANASVDAARNRPEALATEPKPEAPDFAAEAKGMQGRIDALRAKYDMMARAGITDEAFKVKRQADNLAAQQKQMLDIHHHNVKQQREAEQQDAMEGIRQRALAAGMKLPGGTPSAPEGTAVASAAPVAGGRPAPAAPAAAPAGRRPYQRPPENTVVGAPRPDTSTSIISGQHPLPAQRFVGDKSQEAPVSKPVQVGGKTVFNPATGRLVGSRGNTANPAK